jgi:hypothetical protein
MFPGIFVHKCLREQKRDELKMEREKEVHNKEVQVLMIKSKCSSWH